jgi:hypothetical protein
MPRLKCFTGLVPDRWQERESDRKLLFSGSYTSYEPVIQPVQDLLIRYQSFPSCAGESLAACIDAIEGDDTTASGISIWREARRRQGRIEQIDEGTRLQYAVSGLIFRGWDPYQPGEEDDFEEAGLGAPDAGDDLFDEMFADDHRAAGWIRYRIMYDQGDRVDGALSLPQTMGVVIGTGTREAFQRFRGDINQADVILDTDHLGGDHDGHAMRIAGRFYQGGRRTYLLQNSWSRQWGGCHLPDGTFLPGCCWVDERVLQSAWDIHVIGKG